MTSNSSRPAPICCLRIWKPCIGLCAGNPIFSKRACPGYLRSATCVHKASSGWHLPWAKDRSPFSLYTESWRSELLKASSEKSMTSNPENGIVTIPSHHSVDETVARLEKILQEKGIKLFALIDHSGEAENGGLDMRPTKLLIFGNPKAGTPLMIASPSVALDLPLKILVSEDASGKVWTSFNSPAYLQTRHRLPQELVQNIAVVEGL